MNIRLASMLTDTVIDVYRELPEGAQEDDMEDDIRLDDFKDEIDSWVIDELKKNGWTTARSVLDAPREMLVQKADLEEETVDDVLRILREEFAEEEENEEVEKNAEEEQSEA
jgi:N utilization substance protein A